MLAYDFDYKNIEKFLKEYYKCPDLNKEFDYMMSSCRKNNVKIDDIKFSSEYNYPVSMIWKELKKYDENRNLFTEEEWNDEDIFFNSAVTNKKFPAALDMSIHYPTADVIANEIRKFGGKTFIAHVFKYNLKEPFRFLNFLQENKIIDGVEVFHSSFTNEQSKELYKYCTKHNLLISGGTDCHGTKKSSRKLGIGYGNMNVPKSIIKDWN